MASIKEIVEFENGRMEAAQCRRIHLWHEGSFMRAYEWSAWLLCKFVHQFKVTRRQFKGIDAAVVFVGFPKTSLQKFVPEGCAAIDVEEKHTVVDLPIDDSEEFFDTLRAEYAEWTEKQPVTTVPPKEKAAPGTAGAAAPASLTEVMQSILSFPVESKSPIDCMLFLAEMKVRLAHLV